MPPAVHTEIKLFGRPHYAGVWPKPLEIRAPVAAKGCPIAMEDPLTFSFDKSIAPNGSLRPSR